MPVNGSVAVTHKTLKKQLSTEFSKIDDAVAKAFSMNPSDSHAAMPTVVGRLRDLSADHVVGITAAELFAQVYDIPHGNWVQKMDVLYNGISILVPTFMFMQVRQAIDDEYIY